MAISLNSVVGINSTLQSRYQHVSRPKTTSLGMLTSRMHINGGRRRSFVSAADNDRLVKDTSVKVYGGAESSISDNQLSTVNSSSEDSPGGNSVGEESGPQTSGASNGSTVSADMKSRPKRSPLTARERLKAARVLSRYTESKASKSEMGSKVLDAMRESDKGKKRSGLPEAPENMFDDSKRGMPKDGWTFQFPGGSELFFIVVSFVLISSIMFATTYVVWKVGAIHFDEY
ncbi:hypothetical protein POTOM_036587 [Populus tomentosa]|uniref:Uncharacterized protein n=1 Tax=Populus tomentosa TaxID=118781 RepID=A0A8X8CF60_POPTO|nr:hypothetical protein POTOM_036587 [Populus tomentosa]